ncbi:hypothetical protein EPO05_05385 [Patescibacteria group bacterium]|nr:MAG: hypothetical protein EPO05_05385 [Patescibacteria group bacterium]
MAVVLDAGSGFVPLSYDLLREGGIEEVVVLFTHYHHDHTQGLFLSPLIFMKNMGLRLVGPLQNGVDPKQMLEDLMRPPYFPVHHREVDSHIVCKGLEFPKTWLGLFHPQGGGRLMEVDAYEKLLLKGRFLPIGKGQYPVSECLVVTMRIANHPEQTITYRFEERPTKKTFVLLTDHENQSGLPLDVQKHLQNADVIFMDAQYNDATYQKRTSGFGHGTPRYCVRVAKQVGAKRLGLTHHDPNAKDTDVDAILAEARTEPGSEDLDVFLCADYQEIDV